jgi:hypothetical protein
MVWARFDDRYSDSPKIEAAGPWAELLDMRAIIYAAGNLTDGLITRTALTKISAGIPSPLKKAQILVDVGRWDVNPGGGWLIHSFLTYNPSKASVEDGRAKKEMDRAAARERMRQKRSGEQSANVHTNNVGTVLGVGSGICSQPEIEPKSRAPWVRCGMTRIEWVAAGQPEPSEMESA